MKKIIIITYHYPPDMAVGRLRALKFAKYLPEFGYEPVIVTVKEKYYDNSVNRDEKISACIISRTYMAWSMRDIYLYCKGLLAPGPPAHLKMETVPSEVFNDANKPQGFLQSLRRQILSLLFYLPDDKIGWLPFAVIDALRLIRRHDIACVFTTSPPHSTNLIGYLLKKLTGVPWIADFRDPWMIGIERSAKPRTRWSDKIEGYLEGRVVSNADLVMSITQRHTEALVRKYGSLPREKFCTLLSGYDENDFSQLALVEKNSVFTMTYAGNFFLERNPETLLTAVAEFLRERNLAPSAFRLQLLGPCRYYHEKSVDQFAQSLGLESVLEFIDLVPYKRALEYGAAAHVNILLAPDQPYQIPGKSYDLIGIGSNILVLTDEGATFDLMESIPYALVVDYRDVEGIKRAVDSFYEQFERGIMTAHAGGVSDTLSKKALTEMFARLVDTLSLQRQ